MKRIFSLLLVLLLVFTAGCSLKKANNNIFSTATYKENTVLGNGATTFTVTVKVGENATVFTVNTNQTTVGNALKEVQLIDGEESEYGLYIKTVNGITADYDKDQSYWAFYINGEYALTGADVTPIENGKKYEFVYEK